MSRPNRLEFIGRDYLDIRSWWLYDDGIKVGRLFVWPEGGACFYDEDGSMMTNLSAHRSEASTEPVITVLTEHSNFAGRSYRLF